MPVIFKGGTSGNREDAIPSGFDKQKSQPVLNTEQNTIQGNNMNWVTDNPKHKHFQHRTPDFVPMTGTIPEGSEDVAQQDINTPAFNNLMNASPKDIFPNQ